MSFRGLTDSMQPGTYTATLAHRGFRAFLWTQFLGALNDNVCRMVVSMLAVALAAGAGTGLVPQIGILFVLPFLLFSGYAGQLADRFDKRTVLVWTKGFEIVATIAALFAFRANRLDWLLGVLFLMAMQATFFSPAKYGIVPEMLHDRDLSRANGLLAMSTFGAIILGTSLGSMLMTAWDDAPARIGWVLTGIAVLGTAVSLTIPRAAAPNVPDRVRLAPWADVAAGLTKLRGDRTLGLTVLGLAYFWFLGALLQMLLLMSGSELLGLDEWWIGGLATGLAVGIALGSLLAGRLSGDKVELGLVPIGAVGMGVASTALAFAGGSYVATGSLLCVLGFCGGLFVVPLNAVLQQRPRPHEKGQIIATSNVASTVGILAAYGGIWVLRDEWRVPIDAIVLGAGLATILGAIYVLAILPAFFVRFSLWLLTHTVYRIRATGTEHVPFRGPALLVCNHMSHVDGLLVGACVQRFIRFMIYRPYFELPGLRQLFTLMHAIPVSGLNRTDVQRSIERAREELRNGHIVCIFAEGSISRTGNLLPFKRGLERIADGLDIPIVPVHLDQLWGSIFSFKRGRFFWKRPERLPYPVQVTFGAPLPATSSAVDVRQAIQELGAEAFARRFGPRDLLHLRVIRTAKRHWRQFAMADSLGKSLGFGRMLVAALLLSRWVRASTGNERMVGIVLPASVGGALANLAVTLAGKIPVNLNFTAGRDAMAHAMAQCDIRTVITAKTFLARAKLEATPGMVYLEEVMAGLGTWAKLRTLVAARLLPARLLARLYSPEPRALDDVATVIFSSGSTGVPKGVMLTHRNIVSNVEAMAQVFWVTEDDRILGVLPFFHSFGFTGSLWLPLVAGFGVAYHANPMDAQIVGELVERHRVTLLIATPTFCSAYTRKVPAEQFASLRHAIVGAEKLREPIARAFREKYGIDLLEGYGCTEMAPVIAVNVPDLPGGQQRGGKPGTVGHPLPGVAARVVDPDSRQPLPNGTPGLLLVKGANRMLGYLGNPALTAEVVQEGWYVTGDIGSLDDEGFIQLTDRLSRFSKIGGEMVPHLKIEEVLSGILDDAGCVVTGVPDESKGERLVAFYTKADATPQQLWEALNATELPKLWIPKKQDIRQIAEIPLLGTGKVDLRKVKTMASDRDEVVSK